MREIFTEIYKNNKWRCDESKSGPGSRLSVNKKLLYLIEEFVKSHQIKTIIDCGCGDFNWMKHFNFDLIDSYIGFDIVEDLIESNLVYLNEKISFSCSSISDVDLPKSDLIICKDVLFHLSYEDTIKAIENFKRSGSKYLLTTSFTDYINKDIKSGGWRPINLQSHPFNFSNPYIYWENIENRSDSLSNKSMGIWKIN